MEEKKNEFKEAMKYEGKITIPNHEAIQAKYEEARRKLKEEMQLKQKRQEKKARNRKIMYGMMGAIGVTAITIVGYKMAGREGQKEPVKYTRKPVIEQQLEEKELTAKKMMPEEEIKELDAIFKDMYIEAYEIVTGDKKMTTEDIQIEPSDESYVYVNQKTGEIITHGEHPYEIEEKLEQNGVSWQSKGNVRVYKVRNKEGEVIDCVTMEGGEAISVTPSEQYGKEYTSILEKMGTAIPYGLEYKEALEKGMDKETLQDKRDQYREAFVNYEKPMTEHDLEL